jgi:hypothetical protein
VEVLVNRQPYSRTGKPGRNNHWPSAPDILLEMLEVASPSTLTLALTRPRSRPRRVSLAERLVKSRSSAPGLARESFGIRTQESRRSVGLVLLSSQRGLLRVLWM